MTKVTVTPLPASELADEILFFEEAPTYNRSAPLVYGPLTGELLDQRRWFESLRDIKPPPTGVYRFSDAVVSAGVVFTKDLQIVKDSLINRGHETNFAGLRKVADNQFNLNTDFYSSPIHSFDKAILIKQHWDPNYGHWVIEGLPRIAPIRSTLQGSLSEYKIILTNTSSAMMKVYTDSLEFFGIDRSQLVFLGNETLRISNLVYAGPVTMQPWLKSPMIIEALERMAVFQRASPDAANADKKIFIDRLATSRRRLLNLDALRRITKVAGYVEINPSKLSFWGQVRAFSHATHVIGVLGAECTNFVFSPKGIKFFGLAPDLMQDDFYWDLASLKGGEYTSLHGPSLDPTAGMNSDFEVDEALFREVFAQFDS